MGRQRLYRDYVMRDYEEDGARIIDLTFLDEMFTLEVENEVGKPIRLVLTEKDGQVAAARKDQMISTEYGADALDGRPFGLKRGKQ